MNYIKKALSTLGGIFLAALLIAALAPKAAHGIVATLVQVANTSANPVPGDIVRNEENPARQPVQAPVCVSTTGGCFSVTNTYDVPSGQELVIDYVSGQCMTGASQQMTDVRVTTSVGGVYSTDYLNVPLFGSSSAAVTVNFGQVTRIYADPSTAVYLQFDGAGLCNGTLSGHLVKVP